MIGAAPHGNNPRHLPKCGGCGGLRGKIPYAHTGTRAGRRAWRNTYRNHRTYRIGGFCGWRAA